MPVEGSSTRKRKPKWSPVPVTLERADTRWQRSIKTAVTVVDEKLVTDYSPDRLPADARYWPGNSRRRIRSSAGSEARRNAGPYRR